MLTFQSTSGDAGALRHHPGPGHDHEHYRRALDLRHHIFVFHHVFPRDGGILDSGIEDAGVDVCVRAFGGRAGLHCCIIPREVAEWHGSCECLVHVSLCFHLFETICFSGIGVGYFLIGLLFGNQSCRMKDGSRRLLVSLLYICVMLLHWPATWTGNKKFHVRCEDRTRDLRIAITG